jgi:methylglutaconyl-CoA hydratase
VRLCKKLVQDVAGPAHHAGTREDDGGSIADVRVSPEGREGVQSFLQKRKPNWIT